MSRHIRTVMLAMSLSVGVAVPAAADPVSDCYNAVLDKCAAAMEDAAWYEKFALGVLCSGMLAGCTGKAVI